MSKDDPNRKTKRHVAAEVTNGMSALLLDARVTKDVYLSYDSIEKIIFQAQRDVAMKSTSDDERLSLIKSLSIIDNTLKLFAAEGEFDSRA